MSIKANNRPTIGLLSTWSVFQGTTINSYTHTLLQGIYSAAQEQNCNLLIGCSISLSNDPRDIRAAWAVPEPGADFIPVGPWNVDGLIIIPDDFSQKQLDYVQDLIRSGYPIILTTTEKPGPIVAVDNASGIYQAFEHLYHHGHRQIAFIAGKYGRGGDSAERLGAYLSAVQQSGLKVDNRLIAFGEHRREDGRVAMQQILYSGAKFTALMASNDLSAFGAIEALLMAGCRIPDDVAVIGFDDILEARSQLPPLTTVRHPTFTLGYQSVLSALKAIQGEKIKDGILRVNTQLVIRQSCGCRIENTPVIALDSSISLESETTQTILARLMAEATFIEAKHSSREKIEDLCLDTIRAFTTSLLNQDAVHFDRMLGSLIDWLETNGENAYAWHAAFSALLRGFPALLNAAPIEKINFANMLIDQARLAIAELMQRQATNELLKHMVASNRLGLMTSQLLAALEISEISNILTQHLPQIGIEHALVVMYSPEKDDPYASSRVIIDVGLAETCVGRQFPTREFPPVELYISESVYQLVILPMVIDELTIGFVALSATNLEPCAAIVQNLASALRNSQLYRDALKGRQYAEEANHLKSRFLSTVSHELRTPLSLIIGLSGMILQEYPNTSDRIHRDIEEINMSAEHLARLIGDVLDLASSDAGQLRILREPLDLAEVLQLAAKIGEQIALKNGLKWQAQIPSRGPWVLGDRTRLRQIVLNLISNAVKFTPEGIVKVDVSIVDQNVVISVSDSGIGVPPAEQESIFHEFHRSERAIQSGYGGLGLGLTISSQLIEHHNGTIGMRSPGDLGSGSTFYITLPIISTEENENRKTVLLEDHRYPVMVLTEGEDKAEQLCSFLEKRGFDYQVCFVDHQIDWLSTLIESPPAAIILGESLAAREGWAIIGMLKRQPALEHILVLAYSLDSEHNQGEFLELNYLHKPLRAEQVVEELSHHFKTEPIGRTVLIVDDDPGILEMHSHLVKQAGCQVVTARNGREALVKLGQSRPDLILLDLMMPEMDGFAVLEHLRSQEATRDIPVIILTARLLSDADLERLNRGVASILNKGMFNAAETLNHIETVLSQQKTLGGATKQLIRQAMACIHTRFAEPLSREDIASQIGISADHLTDCFHQELGITPITYLRRYRIRQARNLLETTGNSITQIALKVGVPDCAHFSRIFRREVGVTPRAYRDGKRKNPNYRVPTD